jgi:hypothetical protein
VQIVSRNGGGPGVGALLTRNVFRLIDSFPLAYAVGLIATMFTRNHVRIGDLAAGTLLIYAHEDTALAPYAGGHTAGNQLDAATSEVVNELLQRWPALDAAARHRIAQKLLVDAATDDEAALRARLERLAAGGSQ